MSNQFRKRFEEQELEDELLEQEVTYVPEKKTKDGSTTAFFRKLFTEGVVSKEAATDMLPFIIFLCFLGMIYIANTHMAMKNIRSIIKLNNEVKEMNWAYKSLKADLMFKSKLTAVAEKVDTLGLKVLIAPPKKIIVESNEH